MRFLNLQDYETAARHRLPKAIFGFASHGSEDERTLQANEQALNNVALVPRLMRDVSARNTQCELFGEQRSAPFGIAPMGGAALFRQYADLELATAANTRNIPFVLSAASSVPLESVTTAAPHTWYQAYIPSNRERIAKLLDRLRQAHVKVLVITGDVPIPSNRDKDQRLGFSIPLNPTFRLAVDLATHPRWLTNVALRTLLTQGIPRFENYGATRGGYIVSPPSEQFRAGRDRLSWDDFSYIRSQWEGILILKGVLHAEDAKAAIALGADGLIISNHGGRQLDSAISTLDALQHIVPVSEGKPLIIDGGFRRGVDVLKALALGAKFVLLGRPFLYAAAVGGTPAVMHAIDLLQREISIGMGLLGITSLSELRPEHISFPVLSQPAFPSSPNNQHRIG